jgi:hypothetical protein
MNTSASSSPAACSECGISTSINQGKHVSGGVGGSRAAGNIQRRCKAWLAAVRAGRAGMRVSLLQQSLLFGTGTIRGGGTTCPAHTKLMQLRSI